MHLPSHNNNNTPHRLEKVKRLKIGWNARMKEKEYKEMVEKSFELTVKELDKDMMDIEVLVKNLILVEPGE